MDPYPVEIANRQHHLNVDEDFLRDAVTRVLVEERVAAATISLAIVDDPEIHRINRQFLEHDEPTDVMSFLLECEPPVSDEEAIPRGAGKRINGEIVVSAETAVRMAARYGWNPRHELLLYVVHGLLHLCGYDDLTDRERPIMRARERDMLNLWGLTPPFAEPDSGPNRDGGRAETGANGTASR